MLFSYQMNAKRTYRPRPNKIESKALKKEVRNVEKDCRTKCHSKTISRCKKCKCLKVYLALMPSGPSGRDVVNVNFYINKKGVVRHIPNNCCLFETQ
jgi:hypothetical protein